MLSSVLQMGGPVGWMDIRAGLCLRGQEVADQVQVGMVGVTPWWCGPCGSVDGMCCS